MSESNLRDVYSSLARHDEQIAQAQKEIGGIESAMNEYEKQIKKVDLKMASLQGALDTLQGIMDVRLKRIEWLLGFLVLSLIGFACVVLERTVAP